MSLTAVRSLALICALLTLPFHRAYGQAEEALAVPDEQPALPLPADRAVILAVTVNGLAGDPGAVFLQDDNGNLYAQLSFLQAWNLRPGLARLQASDGTDYYELARTNGLNYQWNAARAELFITAVSDQFLPTNISIGAGRIRDVAPYAPGGYLNYDLSLTQSRDANSNAGYFDLALFRDKGLLTSSQIVSSEGSARLMTTWQFDKIATLKTLRLGDSYNNTSAWGRGVLFGGVQYGTNFAIRPDFIPFATPSVSGTALLPSTVDVYVNNALRTRQQVNAGAFSIRNLPVITGTGDVQVVVKDVLGREQLITQPFFASPTLLSKGLVDDSFELGWLRHNYGLASNDYRDAFASVTYRRGVSDSLTGEASVELQQDVQAAGLSIATMLPAIDSVLESSLALSAAKGLSAGAMTSVRYSYLGRHWSASGRMQLYSNDFRQLGSDPARLPRQIVTAQFSAPLGGGTLSVNYLRRLNQGESMTRIANLSYSWKISDKAFASFTLLKPLAVRDGTVASLSVIFIIGRDRVASATLNRQPDGTTAYADFQRATPQDLGTGYRFAALKGGNTSRQEASLTNNQSFGAFQVDLVQLDQEVSARESMRGSIATLGDGVYFGRSLDQGFAVVKTSDIPGVPVLLENQIVARTNASGRALVRNLQPYQQNRISIDPLMLPLETTIGAVEQTVVPRSQGGVVVDFKVRTLRSAILLIVQADGTVLPPWSPVEVAGMEVSYVAGKRGEVFVELPDATANTIIARPAGAPACMLKVDQPAVGSTVPFIGPVTCTPVL